MHKGRDACDFRGSNGKKEGGLSVADRSQERSGAECRQVKQELRAMEKKLTAAISTCQLGSLAHYILCTWLHEY